MTPGLFAALETGGFHGAGADAAAPLISRRLASIIPRPSGVRIEMRDGTRMPAPATGTSQTSMSRCSARYLNKNRFGSWPAIGTKYIAQTTATPRVSDRSRHIGNLLELELEVVANATVEDRDRSFARFRAGLTRLAGRADQSSRQWVNDLCAVILCDRQQRSVGRWFRINGYLSGIAVGKIDTDRFFPGPDVGRQRIRRWQHLAMGTSAARRDFAAAVQHDPKRA
nr:hypothetical protein [Bradyrhizobium sp.]